MDVPNSVLFQSGLRGGLRLPKKPILQKGGYHIVTKNASKQAISGQRRYWDNWDMAFGEDNIGPDGPKPFEIIGPRKEPAALVVAAALSNVLEAGRKLGNIPFMDYRFWIGAEEPESRFSQCRACGKTAFSHLARLKHIQTSAHTVLLVEAYELLRRDRLCVVCDEPSHSHTKWGVPLCKKPSCMYRWMFKVSNASLPGLSSALRIIKSPTSGSKYYCMYLAGMPNEKV